MGVCACSKRCSLVLAEMFIEMSVIQLFQEDYFNQTVQFLRIAMFSVTGKQRRRMGKSINCCTDHPIVYVE